MKNLLHEFFNSKSDANGEWSLLYATQQERLENEFEEWYVEKYKPENFKENANKIYEEYKPSLHKSQKTPKNMFLLGCQAGLIRNSSH